MPVGVHIDIPVVQSQKEFKPGEKVSLEIDPDSIHIMKKMLTENKHKGVVSKEGIVSFCGGDWEIPTEGFEVGDEVLVHTPFTAVELMDDEEDGVVGANVTQAYIKVHITKFKYIQIQMRTSISILQTNGI